jgi:glycosyltransferase involved in cell wall biosynthesis
METASWAKLRQTDPPDFGRAKQVPRWWLRCSVHRRRARAERIIFRAREICDFDPCVVSVVILSCKRLVELQRLAGSLNFFLENFEDYTKIEKVLIDNGSGPQLVRWSEDSGFFDRIIAHEQNLGMAVALDDAFPQMKGEYILLIEDDFVVDYDRPFLKSCLTLFDEYPEIGIIRLKDQRNWGKPHRIIGPLRHTSDGTEFWTWLPSFNGELNVWAAGSVLFRKVSFMATGRIDLGPNVGRDHPKHQGVLYEEVYGKRYNRNWLAAKMRNCYPFVQPNDNPESSGWGEVMDGSY